MTIHYVTVGSTRGVTLSFDDMLESGEVVSTISSVLATGLTISGEAVTTATVEVFGKTIGIGRAITFTVAGGVANTKYTVVATVVTDGSQTIVDDSTVLIWEATG